MESKSERGAVIIEAVLSLTLFMFALLRRGSDQP